jgi:uncharacterized protein (DUF1330 family)
MAMAVHLCVLLWANPDAEGALSRYEDQVLELMADHGARVLQRVRSAGLDGAPTEVQILEYPSEDALEAYVADERRTALAGDREAAIARTEVIPVEIIGSGGKDG